jgi:hypothetical protein
MPSDQFKHYAWFSVQVDQYYAAVKIYARNHAQFCDIYRALPRGDDWPSDLGSVPLSESAKEFFIIASSTFNYMGTTGVFAPPAHEELRHMPADMINFGFYTCFCFQWTLFETFIKDSVLRLVDDKILTESVSKELRKRERSTGSFLSYIDKGHVFGRSPFTTVLPVAAWVPKTETCTFDDLNRIRELRNNFIHAVPDRAILPASEVEKERLYERSMWIMRKFAENVDHETLDQRKQHAAQKS